MGRILSNASSCWICIRARCMREIRTYSGNVNSEFPENIRPSRQASWECLKLLLKRDPRQAQWEGRSRNKAPVGEPVGRSFLKFIFVSTRGWKAGYLLSTREVLVERLLKDRPVCFARFIKFYLMKPSSAKRNRDNFKKLNEIARRTRENRVSCFYLFFVLN